MTLEDKIEELEEENQQLKEEIKELEEEAEELLNKLIEFEPNSLDDEFKLEFFNQYKNDFTPWELEVVFKMGKNFFSKFINKR